MMYLVESWTTIQRGKHASCKFISFYKMRVYEYSIVNECWKRTGKRPNGTRWVDIHKGDSSNLDVRSRFVGQEINTGANDDLYAATLQIQALKVLLRIAAERRFRNDTIAILLADVLGACFNAKVNRDICFRNCLEDSKFKQKKKFKKQKFVP